MPNMYLAGGQRLQLDLEGKAAAIPEGKTLARGRWGGIRLQRGGRRLPGWRWGGIRLRPDMHSGKLTTAYMCA